MARQIPELDELLGNHASENDMMLIRDESAKQDKRISLKELSKALGGGSDLVDMIYPVGSYYETSDASFDPNEAWGGTWVKDTAGRVLVAQNDGTFDTVGATGGNEKNTHQHWQTSGSDNGSSYDLRLDDGLSVTGLKTRVITAARVHTTGSYSTTGTRQHTTYNETIDILQPYKVVVRWHRTA